MTVTIKIIDACTEEEFAEGHISSEELVRLGYTNLKEFSGIIDRPYKIVI